MSKQNYRVELHQGDKCIWKGPWIANKNLKQCYEIVSSQLKEAVEANSIFGYAIWNNHLDETTFIPKSVLSSSIVVIAKEGTKETVNEESEK